MAAPVPALSGLQQHPIGSELLIASESSAARGHWSVKVGGAGGQPLRFIAWSSAIGAGAPAAIWVAANKGKGTSRGHAGAGRNGGASTAGGASGGVRPPQHH